MKPETSNQAAASTTKSPTIAQPDDDVTSNDDVINEGKSGSVDDVTLEEMEAVTAPETTVTTTGTTTSGTTTSGTTTSGTTGTTTSGTTTTGTTTSGSTTSGSTTTILSTTEMSTMTAVEEATSTKTTTTTATTIPALAPFTPVPSRTEVIGNNVIDEDDDVIPTPKPEMTGFAWTTTTGDPYLDLKAMQSINLRSGDVRIVDGRQDESLLELEFVVWQVS